MKFKRKYSEPWRGCCFHFSYFLQWIIARNSAGMKNKYLTHLKKKPYPFQASWHDSSPYIIPDNLTKPRARIKCERRNSYLYYTFSDANQIHHCAEKLIVRNKCCIACEMVSLRTFMDFPDSLKR